MSDSNLTEALHQFFATVCASARHGKVLVAFDHRNDLDLLGYALDGFEATQTRTRPLYNAFNLGMLGVEFNQAVEKRFASDKAVRARRHHALTDARVNREAYIALRERDASNQPKGPSL